MVFSLYSSTTDSQILCIYKSLMNNMTNSVRSQDLSILREKRGSYLPYVGLAISPPKTISEIAYRLTSKAEKLPKHFEPD
jgi:hypothetical protein